MVKTHKGDEDRYTYDELMETCANIAHDVENQKKQIEKQREVITKQEEMIKTQGAIIETQGQVINKHGADLIMVQKVVFHQDKEIKALQATVGKLLQEK